MAVHGDLDLKFSKSKPIETILFGCLQKALKYYIDTRWMMKNTRITQQIQTRLENKKSPKRKITEWARHFFIY